MSKFNQVKEGIKRRLINIFFFIFSLGVLLVIGKGLLVLFSLFGSTFEQFGIKF
jgi:hypothetical protein